jgi:hypothetical protein
MTYPLTRIFFFLTLLFSGIKGDAQVISYGTSLDIDDVKTSYSILGTDSQFVYVLQYAPQIIPRIITCNHNLEKIATADKPFLKNSFLLSFVRKNNSLELFCENYKEGFRVYSLYRQSGDNLTVNEILRLPPATGGKWDFISSPSGNFFMLYSVTSMLNDSVNISAIVLNKNYEVLDGKRFSYFLDRQFDMLGLPAIDDEGNIYNLIYDRPLNYRLGSNLRLLRFNTALGNFTRKEIYFKEKKPTDVRLSFSLKDKTVFLHSLFYDFYSKDINGLMTCRLTENLELLNAPSYFVFDKDFKKKLNTYKSGINSGDLMNYLHINSTSVFEDGNSYINMTLETDRIPSNNGSNSNTGNISSTTQVDDPMMDLLQRENLIRRNMAYSGPVRGRRFSSAAGPNISYAEAYTNAMFDRPDLFFMPADSSLNSKTRNDLLKKKIYDRQLLLGFDKNNSVKWLHWYETEDQSLLKKNSLVATETDSSFVSIYYRHNSKDKPEPGFTKVNKADGALLDKPLNIPPHISLLTTNTVYKLGSDKIVMLYYDNRTGKTGLAKIEW